MMKSLKFLALPLLLAACGDDAPPTAMPDMGMATPDMGMATPDMGMATPDMGMATPDMGVNMPPPPPSLGSVQIDRVGRAGVTTALIAVLQPDDPRGMARDAYNGASSEQWGSYLGEIAGNLAVYDSLDTVCGNQVLAGPNAEAGRYNGLAGALADDRLYLRTTATSCGQYLAVELDATGVAANMDCGGRTPNYDTIDVTYSALAVGGVSGVGDGVPADDKTHDEGTFPFLAAP